MRKVFAVLVICLAVLLTSCGTQPKVVYTGVLEGVSTTKGTTTITFADNVAVTRYYNSSYSDNVLVYGKVYTLMTRVDSFGSNQVWLVVTGETSKK
jgi:hypothetical protein